MPRTRSHHFMFRLTRAMRVALWLPLLLLLQPGHPGSWFCGSGAWCGSTADLTCCCGPAHETTADGCAESAGPHLGAAAHSCDCYYQASPAPAAHPPFLLALSPPEASPAPEFLLPVSPALKRGYHAAARTERPPPLPLSGTVTRGPPASPTLPT